MKRFPNQSLLRYNTFGIDQKCDELIVFENENDAVMLASELHQHTAAGDRLLLLGGGSNLLLTRDFDGKVVTPKAEFSISVIMEAGTNIPYLKCWAGTTFDDVVDYAVRHGYYGMENLSLIPGQCGASAVQNIGAYGAEAKDFISEIEAVEIATGRVVHFTQADCHYSYRQSRFKNEWKNRYLITYVTYRLSRKFEPILDYGNVRSKLSEAHIDVEALTAQQLRDTIIEIRHDKLPDPAVTGNAGSFFMNPIIDEETFRKLKEKVPDLHYFKVDDRGEAICNDEAPRNCRYKIPAGWMIERCGWKGKSLGHAGVHSKQALVLINEGGATGQDIVNLMQAIQHDVKAAFGLDIRPEVNVI